MCKPRRPNSSESEGKERAMITMFSLISSQHSSRPIPSLHPFYNIMCRRASPFFFPSRAPSFPPFYKMHNPLPLVSFVDTPPTPVVPSREVLIHRALVHPLHLWKRLLGINSLFPFLFVKVDPIKLEDYSRIMDSPRAETFYDAADSFASYCPPRPNLTIRYLLFFLHIGFLLWWLSLPCLVTLTPSSSLDPEWVSLVREFSSVPLYTRDPISSKLILHHDPDLFRLTLEMLESSRSTTFDPLHLHSFDVRTLSFLMGACFLSIFLVGESFSGSSPYLPSPF